MSKPTFKLIVTELETNAVKESKRADSKYAAKNFKNALRLKYPETKYRIETFKERK